jgi:SAM-dependent methyltransferase
MAGGIRLHIGAFDCAIDGWLNTDITPHIWISRIPFMARLLFAFGFMDNDRFRQHQRGVFSKLKYMDLTRPLPLKDGSVSVVFSSHVFEHLFSDEVGSLIHELHRVLVPAGICRVVVPDLEKIIAMFNADFPEPFLESVYEAGKRYHIKNAHHWGFTGSSLTRLFLNARFSKAYVTRYHEGACPDLELLDNRPDSLFVEAIR